MRVLFFFNVHWVNEPTEPVDTESLKVAVGNFSFVFFPFSFVLVLFCIFLKTEQCYRLIAYGSQLMS